jgi:hypothetical protein
MFIDVAEEAAVAIRNICYTLALVFHSFIHSFRSLSYDISTASSNASYPQSAIWCFLFQFAVPSRFLKVIQ